MNTGNVDISKLEELILAPLVEFPQTSRAILDVEGVDGSGLWAIVQLLSGGRFKVRNIDNETEVVAHHSLLRPIDPERAIAEVRKRNEMPEDPRDVPRLATPEDGPATPACATHGVPLDEEGHCPTCFEERRKDRIEREERADKRYVSELADRFLVLWKAAGESEKDGKQCNLIAAAMMLAERLDNIEEQLRQIATSLDRLDR